DKLVTGVQTCALPIYLLQVDLALGGLLLERELDPTAGRPRRVPHEQVLVEREVRVRVGGAPAVDRHLVLAGVELDRELREGDREIGRASCRERVEMVG